MGWFDDRFIEDSRKIKCACSVCGKSYWLPASKANKYITCGTECAIKRRFFLKELRKRSCVTCGKTFYPRWAQINVGKGVYCSQKCNTASINAINTAEAHIKAAAGFKKAIVEGRYIPPSGEQNSRWKGGKKAIRKALIESGVLAARVRDYRARNPHKVREFQMNRNGKKIGRLPKGTVKNIGNLQKWKCAICNCSISEKYHVDHIYPLAKGGSHDALNIQLLCQSCNVRKSAKDPIKYMQERGFLL